MSTHRINFTPEPLRKRTGRSPLIAGAAFVGLTLFTWGLVGLLMHIGQPAAVATPVRTPDVQIFPIEPHDSPRLAQIRIEAFRAGYESAAQDGCRPALAMPITGVQR